MRQLKGKRLTLSGQQSLMKLAYLIIRSMIDLEISELSCLNIKKSQKPARPNGITQLQNAL